MASPTSEPQDAGVEDLLGEVVPSTSQTLNVFETTRDIDVGSRNLRVGDVTIHTTGAVYTAPVTIEQHVTVQRAASTSSNAELKTQAREKCEELKSKLKEKVVSIASEESSLTEITQKRISPVELSIDSKPHQIDDEFQAEGHYRTKAEFAKLYEGPNDRIMPEEMFSRAQQSAKREAGWKFKPDQTKVKEEYVEKHGNVVAVLGQAGIGKTTSTKSWALEALEREMFGSVSYFFYIVVRFVDFKTKMSFIQFLLHTMLPAWKIKDEVASEVFDDITSDPNVLLIFDGLDEAAFQSFSKETPLPGLHSKNKAEAYLKNLAGGHLLPRARKIFTSRPAPFYDLQPSHRPRFIVQILGLTSDSQHDLGSQICGERYPAVREKLEQNKSLFAYCYVPVNFILTAHHLIEYSGDVQFVSLSRVLAFTCVKYSQTCHLKDRHRFLDKLAKMAWNGFRDKKVVFKSRDFKDAKIRDEMVDAFLNTCVTKKGNFMLTILEGHKRKYFSHLIWQEFFAALYLMMIMPLTEFKKQHTRLSESRCEVVAKFVFGICDPSVFNELEAVVSKSSRKVWDDKKLLLRNLASSLMKKRTKDAMSRCCSWAHEANDEEITSSVSSSLPHEIDLSDSSLLPADLANLSFVIGRRSKPLKKLDLSRIRVEDHGATSVGSCIHNIEEVYLPGCDLSTFGVEQISKSIMDMPTRLKKLDLSGNKLGDPEPISSIGNCIHKLEEVDLSVCSLTSIGAKQLSKKMADLETPLRKVNLSWNKIGDPVAVSIGNCIHKMREVDLSGCGLTRRGVEQLSQKVKELEQPLKKVNLSSNKIGDEGAASIGDCIHNVEEVDLGVCDLTGSGAEQLSKKIKELKTPLKNLDLNGNKIGDNGADFIGDCIHNTEKLDLGGCDLTSVGVEHLCKKILKAPMKSLNLSTNKIGDPGATSVGSCIHNIQEVDLRGCDVTNLGVENLSKKIKKSKTRLKRLNLYGNKIGDLGAASIGNCIHNMEEVDLGQCDLTNLGIETLCKKIKDMKTTLRKVNLSWNKIGDPGASSIGNCIHKMREVDLSGCGLTRLGVEQLSKKIKELKQPIRMLILSRNSLTDECAEMLANCVHNIEVFEAGNCEFTGVGESLIRSRSNGEVDFELM